MKVIKTSNPYTLIDCEKCDGWNYKEINSIDEDLFDDYKVSIVYDEDEGQYYVVDRLTHLILSCHLSVTRCIDWLYRTGFELIELKRKYDSKRYNEDIVLWRSLQALLKKGVEEHVKEKNID